MQVDSILHYAILYWNIYVPVASEGLIKRLLHRLISLPSSRKVIFQTLPKFKWFYLNHSFQQFNFKFKLSDHTVWPFKILMTTISYSHGTFSYMAVFAYSFTSANYCSRCAMCLHFSCFHMYNYNIRWWWYWWCHFQFIFRHLTGSFLFILHVWNSAHT